MERKPNKSSSCNCDGNIAKKNNVTQLEWGDVFSGALRWLTCFNTAWRTFEIVKSLLEQSNLLS